MLDRMSRIVRTRPVLYNSGVSSANCKNRIGGNGTRDHRNKTNNHKPPTSRRDEEDNQQKHQEQPPKKAEQREDSGRIGDAKSMEGS